MVYIQYSNLNLIKSIDIVEEVGSNHPRGINSTFIYKYVIPQISNTCNFSMQNYLMWKKELGP